MKITPLVMLAAMRIPGLTGVFSDTLAVASMVVTEGGDTVITCTGPHGIVVGQQQAMAVVDALTPNAIVDWEVLDNDDVTITVAEPHAMTTTPDVTLLEPNDSFARISGTGVSGLDGTVQLVSVDTPTAFTVRPGGSVTLPGSIPGAAVLLERLERDIIGWHAVTATSATALSFPTPATVQRSYTVDSPQIARNIRVWGAVDLEHALLHWTRADMADLGDVDQAYMFICPSPQSRLSRDRNSRSDAIVEITPGAFVNQLLMDSFELFVALPSEKYGGAIKCVDLCHGQILRAVMQTFNGLKLPYTEFASPNPHLVMMSGHGVARYTKANYVHRYTFDAQVYITEDDTAASIELPDLTAFDAALTAGDPAPTDPIQPIGSVPWTGGVSIAPDPAYGIYQHDKPQPLTAVIPILPAS